MLMMRGLQPLLGIASNPLDVANVMNVIDLIELYADLPEARVPARKEELPALGIRATVPARTTSGWLDTAQGATATSGRVSDRSTVAVAVRRRPGLRGHRPSHGGHCQRHADAPDDDPNAALPATR